MVSTQHSRDALRSACCGHNTHRPRNAVVPASIVISTLISLSTATPCAATSPLYVSTRHGQRGMSDGRVLWTARSVAMHRHYSLHCMTHPSVCCSFQRTSSHVVVWTLTTATHCSPTDSRQQAEQRYSDSDKERLGIPNVITPTTIEWLNIRHQSYPFASVRSPSIVLSRGLAPVQSVESRPPV